MHRATKENVLGNFDNSTFDYFGEQTTFFKKEDQYIIKTLGPDGKPHEYPVLYTFGYEPLQQYLIEIEPGRIQALTIAWDTKQQKWFHLYPDEHIKIGDPLHWSKHLFNWNTNCAECHSTNVEKSYDDKLNSYHTTFDEINISCQSCHGKMQNHPQKGQKLSTTFKRPIEMCARCHARRHHVSPSDKSGESFYDHFFPSLLSGHLYYDDGQIKEENFVYGSFLQSKMYRAGVTCLDCHNPHSLQLKTTGNALCAQCHNPNGNPRFPTVIKKNYDTIEHHHHKVGSAGAQCINCHMPQTTYMRIDHRADHQFSIPRPDLTIKIGVPNACNRCHKNKSANWAYNQTTAWYGAKKYPEHFGEVFHGARKGDPQAENDLIKLIDDNSQANIVRATALELLTPFSSANSISARQKALHHDHQLIRASAARSSATLPTNEKIRLLAPLLQDPSRSVRIEVIGILNAINKNQIPEKLHNDYDKAIIEYKALQKFNYDIPSGHFNMGNFYAKHSHFKQSIASYQQALKLDPSFFPAAQAIATVYQQLGQNDKAKQSLKTSIQAAPQQGELYYSLGLLYAEQKNLTDALPMLAKASKLLPDHVRVHYNYALALQHAGKLQHAEQVMLAANKVDPHNPDVMYALATFYIKQRKWHEALTFAQRLQKLIPNAPQIKQMVDFIRSQQ